jgi:hypothetical protein
MMAGGSGFKMTDVPRREFHKTQMMTAVQAREWDQSAFRRFLIRGWVAYHPGKGFYMTPDGMIAWNGFQRTDVRRNDPSAC